LEITFLGYSSFKIQGKNITIVTDPFSPEEAGLPFPKVEADVVSISHDHPGHNNKKDVKGSYICFDTPGEYEIKNTQITGIESLHSEEEEGDKNTIFTFEVDGVNLCHLGDLGIDLNPAQVEKINGVDILFIPVGGKKTIDAKKAVKVISAVGPKVVIPMHFKSKNGDLDGVESFIKEMGKEPKSVDKLKITKKELPEELTLITF
jgi:L-ascorbate metabolism protein UlaG (beta-lactamase superfamily)